MPYTLATQAHSELIIRKSRFIGCVQPMADRAAAQAAVDALWRAHPGAAHICWGLLAGGHSAAVDDGEPSGTARSSTATSTGPGNPISMRPNLTVRLTMTTLTGPAWGVAPGGGTP